MFPRFAAILLLVAACDEPAPTIIADRQFGSVSWDTLWTAVSQQSDSAFSSALKIVADDEHVYLLDSRRHALVALRANDGTLAWKFGTTWSRDSGLVAPADLSMDENGDVLVADPAQDRIVVVSSAGGFRRTIPLAPPASVHSMCVLRGGDIVHLRLSPQSPLRLVNSAGQKVTDAELPWPSKRGVAPQLFQGLLAPVRDGRACTFALQTGEGFSVWQDGRFHDTVPYVEQVKGDVQRLGSTALSITSDSNSTIILFGGRTAYAGRVLDYYSDSVGEYKGSLLLPWPSDWITRFNDLYYVIRDDRGVNVISAVRKRATN